MKAMRPLVEFLIAARAAGRSTALVTITGVTGGSARAPGTHLAVDDAGEWHGSLSGGCIEAAVVAEARRVIAAGVAETIRFGAGSRFIDIRLPCGGGMDLLFTPLDAKAPLEEMRERLMARRPIGLALDVAGGLVLEAPPTGTGWDHAVFRVRHDPDLRLVVVGHGAETIALARLADAHGAIVEVHTPDPRVAAQCRDLGVEAGLLRMPGDGRAIVVDPHAAVVLLFHDHDWETGILAPILEQQPFFVGAMGSRQTHRRRLAALHAMGVAVSRTMRVIGPVGFLPASRDPETLALSILGQVVAHQHAATGREACAARDAAMAGTDQARAGVERPARPGVPIGEIR